MARIGEHLTVEKRGHYCQWPPAIAVWLSKCPKLN